MSALLQGVIPRLPVLDLGRTVAFYSRVLGFRISLLFPEEAPIFCVLDRDSISLGFFTTDQTRIEVVIGTVELYLAVEDVQALFVEIRDQVFIEWGPEVYVYGRREFAIRDPDGYLLIFTEPTDDLPTCLEA